MGSGLAAEFKKCVSTLKYDYVKIISTRQQNRDLGVSRDVLTFSHVNRFVLFFTFRHSYIWNSSMLFPKVFLQHGFVLKS